MTDSKSGSQGADWTELLTDHELIPHLSMLLQAYRDALPDRRDEILTATLRKIKSASKSLEDAPSVDPAEVSIQSRAAGPSVTPPFEPELFTSKRGDDRRRHDRMKCFIAVELRLAGSTTPLWGNISNTSLGGCFVETAAAIASGAKLEIGLWVATGKVWIKGLVLNGIVTSTNPSVGARVKFDDLGMSQRETLRQFMKFVDKATQEYQAEHGYLAQMKR